MPADNVALQTLRTRADFLRITRECRKVGTRTCVVQVARSAYSTPLLLHVGFTATKKLGNAVVRNRVKRRLREAARTVLQEQGKIGEDYVFIGRDAAIDAPYAMLLEDVRYALRKLHKKT